MRQALLWDAAGILPDPKEAEFDFGTARMISPRGHDLVETYSLRHALQLWAFLASARSFAHLMMVRWSQTRIDPDDQDAFDDESVAFRAVSRSYTRLAHALSPFVPVEARKTAVSWYDAGDPLEVGTGWDGVLPLLVRARKWALDRCWDVDVPDPNVSEKIRLLSVNVFQALHVMDVAAQQEDDRVTAEYGVEKAIEDNLCLRTLLSFSRLPEETWHQIEELAAE